jgi:hypothetical protein
MRFAFKTKYESRSREGLSRAFGRLINIRTKNKQTNKQFETSTALCFRHLRKENNFYVAPINERNGQFFNHLSSLHVNSRDKNWKGVKESEGANVRPHSDKQTERGENT